MPKARFEVVAPMSVSEGIFGYEELMKKYQFKKLTNNVADYPMFGRKFAGKGGKHSHRIYYVQLVEPEYSDFMGAVQWQWRLIAQKPDFSMREMDSGEEIPDLENRLDVIHRVHYGKSITD